MKRVVLILCFLLIMVLLTCCTDDRIADDKVDNKNSSSATGSIRISRLNTDPFASWVHEGSFDDFAKIYQESGVDGFIRYGTSPEYLEVTEQRIADRRMELTRSFPGYTYVPCYDGKSFEIVESDPLCVFVPSHAQERNAGCTLTDSDFYTDINYTAAVVHEDGNKTYAYINIIHGKEMVAKAWSSVLKGGEPFVDYKGSLYGQGKDEYGEVVIDGEAISYCRAYPMFYDANYIFKYNEETIIAISFFSSEEWVVDDEIDFFERFDDHCLPEEFMTTEWLSNLSFEKYNFGKTDDGSMS